MRAVRATRTTRQTRRGDAARDRAVNARGGRRGRGGGGRTTAAAPAAARTTTRAGRGGRGRAGRGGRAGRTAQRRRKPQLPNDVNAPTQQVQYHNILATFMEYKNNVVYPDEKTFTNEELLAIQPRDIYKWMCFKAYGKEDPGQDDNPTEIRSSTLHYWKKSISYFMPNKSATWTVSPHDPTIEAGNPTKSALINDLITAVERKECRGIGKDSQADRPYTRDEYLQAYRLLGCHGTPINRLRHQAMIKFQVHLIARGDDTSHVMKKDLIPNSQFPQYLTTKLRRSKNVKEERDCPRQLMMGAMDPDFCVLLSLAIWLEKWVSMEGATSQWLFADGTTDSSSLTEDMDKEAEACRALYAKHMKDHVVDNPSFEKANDPGELGTHSVKKFANTYCRSRGCHRDDTNYRARWKSDKQVQDRYCDTQLTWPDVKSASKLCKGGVCLYKVKDGLGVTDEWIAREIAPAITGTFGAAVGATLGKPLLWACFETSIADVVPGDILHNRVGKFHLLQTDLPDGQNPIEKVEVLPSEVDGTVSLDVIPREAGTQGSSELAQQHTQWRAAMYAKVSSTAIKVTEMQQHQIAEISDLKREIRRLKEIVRSIAVAPARRVGPGMQIVVGDGGNAARYGNTDQGQDSRPAVLQRCPKTLELLWEEWQNGIERRLPARLFTRSQRGRVKYSFSRRLPFWKCMMRLLSRGNTVQTAIAKIKAVYGDVPVSYVLQKIRPDEKEGGHANLQH